MLQFLPISQRRDEKDVRAAAHEEITPCGSMTASMIAGLDMELGAEPCPTVGADAGQTKANEPACTADLFGSFPSTPSQRSCALDVPASLREPSRPAVSCGASLATPQKWSRPLSAPQPQQSSWPAPPPPRESSELPRCSSAPAGSPQLGSEALGSERSSSAQQSTGALGPASSSKAPPKPSAGALSGQHTFYPPKVALRRASKKRKPEEAELREQQRRKRVCFNVQDAMRSDAPAVKACLTGFKMPPWLYEALRVKYIDYYRIEHEDEANSMTGRQFRQCARGHFSKCGNALRLKLLKKMLDEHDTVSEKWTDIKMSIAKIQHGNSPHTLDRDKKVKAQVAMFTSQSEDWFLDELALEEGAEPWEPESLVARAKDLPKTIAVWGRYVEFVDEKAKELSAKWVASLEICTTTYVETGKVRFHLAVVLCRMVPIRFSPPWDFLEFENAPAIYSPRVDETTTQKMAKKLGIHGVFGQAAYYLQMPKIGMVFNDGTMQPYKDYRVNARWVTEYLQAGAWDVGSNRVRALGLAILPVSY